MSTDLLEVINRIIRMVKSHDIDVEELVELKITVIDIIEGILEAQSLKSKLYERVLSVRILGPSCPAFLFLLILLYFTLSLSLSCYNPPSDHLSSLLSSPLLPYPTLPPTPMNTGTTRGCHCRDSLPGGGARGRTG